ncbi:hypothetical protein MTR_2g449760 [Medicago truncatula]|uniref:Uncharacterized protein n=1 Tax=Medicago truncatula TaxID=3880 RepID=A0A072V7Q3_MEDTR|nr:hypothetical protein MTR_2g449760 [Medicago truncatula]
MIYSIYKNNGKGRGFSDGRPNEISLKSCCECIKEGLKTYFVPEVVESEIVIQSEPEASSYKTVNISKSKNSKSKFLKNSESRVLKPKFQRRKTIVASWDSRPKGAKPKVFNEHKPLNFKRKAQKNKTKTFRINPKGPIKILIPKSEILDATDMLKKKGKSEIIIPGQWLLTTHDRRKVYRLIEELLLTTFKFSHK